MHTVTRNMRILAGTGQRLSFSHEDSHEDGTMIWFHEGSDVLVKGLSAARVLLSNP